MPVRQRGTTHGVDHPYSALLDLHLLAVALFVGSVLMIAFILPGFGRQVGADRLPEVRRLRSMARLIVTPALLLVWGLGISLAIEGGWFVASWLHAKIALVLVLSAVHGFQLRQLRRLASGVPLERAYLRWWPLIIAVVVIAIIGLATGKPG